MRHPLTYELSVGSSVCNRLVCGLMQTLRWGAAGIPSADVIDIY
jgi:hypothetical protein